MTFKKSSIFFLLFITVQCVPVFALSLGESCFKNNKNFITRYFSGQSNLSELENFFNCIDNSIQLFLNHTRTANSGYYTQIELRRIMQYIGMGLTKAQKMSMSESEYIAKAEQISKTIFNLKRGFIRGDPNRLHLTEINLCKKILSILRKRMRAMHSSMPILTAILNKKNISRKQLMQATDTMKTNFITLGNELSKLSFSSNLSILNQLPEEIQKIGFSNTNLQYWKPALRLLAQWKNMFLNSQKNIIQKKDWPALLDTFGQMAALWFYYKRFLESRSLLDFRIIQHTQHFISHSLNIIRKAQKQSGKNNIFLSDIDELARRVWFLPHLSKPIFRLSLRSAFCFIISPLKTKQTCKYNTTNDINSENFIIHFSDLTFTITDTKEIYESSSGDKSDKIQKEHWEILRKNLNSWIKSENTLRTTSQLPTSFGSPQQWLKRNINITSDKRISFYEQRTDNTPLLSSLNWQSHLMKLITSAYTERENQVTPKLWNTMIKEWTAFSIALYKDMKWQHFQRIGFQIFKHGDFLTSYSNGDKILQEEEILELFSFFASSLRTIIYTLDSMPSCSSSKPYHLTASCFWNNLQDLPPSVFAGFPQLIESLSNNEDKKVNYINRLSSFYSAQEDISFKSLFEMFLFMHYQENTMENLDQDYSQHLSTRELEPLLPVFEQTLINDMPFVYKTTDAFAFITYLFHYSEVPIFSDTNKISSPIRFSNWLLQPQKWQLQIDREKILHTLFLINKKLGK